SGYVALLGDSAISWASKRHVSVATSSMEAEYMAASFATHHLLWLQTLLDELYIDSKSYPIPLLIDNRSAIDLTKDAKHHQRTKHIDIAHHFVRERVMDGTLNVIHCPGSEMLADGFTNSLATPSFTAMVDGLKVMP